jgi:hypothetical protein
MEKRKVAILHWSIGLPLTYVRGSDQIKTATVFA